MRPAVRAAVLVGGAALIACNASAGNGAPPDPGGTTAVLSLRPLRPSLTREVVADSGFRAMFLNDSPNAVSLQGGGCGQQQALYERWTGAVWQTIASPSTPCRIHAIGVAAGDSALTGGGAQTLAAGSYRLRLPTTGGSAISVLVEIR